LKGDVFGGIIGFGSTVLGFGQILEKVADVVS
jgi:hypothetical protein